MVMHRNYIKLLNTVICVQFITNWPRLLRIFNACLFKASIKHFTCRCTVSLLSTIWNLLSYQNLFTAGHGHIPPTAALFLPRWEIQALELTAIKVLGPSGWVGLFTPHPPVLGDNAVPLSYKFSWTQAKKLCCAHIKHRRTTINASVAWADVLSTVRTRLWWYERTSFTTVEWSGIKGFAPEADAEALVLAAVFVGYGVVVEFD